MISDGVRQLITGRPPVDYLACNHGSQGRLPGCRFEWDNVDAQCVTGRQGIELEWRELLKLGWREGGKVLTEQSNCNYEICLKLTPKY